MVSVRSIVGQLPRGALAASLLTAVLLIVVALVPGSLGHDLTRAFVALPAARPVWLAAGCGMFGLSLLCSAGGWRTAVRACGARIELRDAVAWYAAGSLASSLLPARAGDGVRFALFSGRLPKEARLWTMSGILLTLSVARAAVLLGLVLAAVVLGQLPAWPLAALGGVTTISAILAVRLRRTQPRSRVAHLFDAFRALGRSPRTACVLAGWAAGSIAARVAAATAAAAAFGASSPLLAALVIVPALELAGMLPLTPGNLGIAEGTVAVALHAAGARLTAALTIGIGLHAVETLASVGFGSWSLLYLTCSRVGWLRRPSSVVGRPDLGPPSGHPPLPPEAPGAQGHGQPA
jgi:glycosyltransferase 2 family protein